ncbi:MULTISPECIES: hypothetical protein [Sulfolobaceae]|nr:MULTISPECIES: hypothetical protein [unclassified Sulfolobus]
MDKLLLGFVIANILLSFTLSQLFVIPLVLIAIKFIFSTNERD